MSRQRAAHSTIQIKPSTRGVGTLALSILACCVGFSSAQAATLKSEDVGSPTLAGSTTQAGGKITVVGGGADIWGSMDQFHFAYIEVTNNFDYEVRVEDLQGPDAWTKAELMAREAQDLGSGLDPEADDRHINVMTTRTAGQNEVALQWRANTRGGSSQWPNDIGITSPIYRPTYPNTWLRLMRYEDKFYALASTNGVNWTNLRGSPYDTASTNGNQTTPALDGPFANRLTLGLAVTAHLDSDPTGGRAVFSEFRPHVPVAIAISGQPQATVNMSANTPLTLSVAATGDPVLYQWRKNGTDIAGATAATYSVPLAQTTDSGTYSVRLFGPGQTEVMSGNSVVTVTTDNLAPTIANVSAAGSFISLVVDFSEPVDASAEDAGNFKLDKGVTVTGVTRPGPSRVQLTTSKMAELTDYTLTINGVKDTAGNTIAANSTKVFKTFAFTKGFARWERWNDQGDTGNIDTWVSNLAKPDFRAPDVTGYSTYLGSPRGAADNYGLRASGIFTPTQTGNYVFFLACDDQGYLFLSPDADPAKKKKIAYQPGYSDYAQWNDPDTTDVRSDLYSGSEWSTPNTITLTAGNQYYIEVEFREGGGGDGSEVFYKFESAPDPSNGQAPNITGAVLGTIVDPTGATITFNQQPQNATIVENASATFSVQATGSSSTLLYQWQKAVGAGAFQDIPGETGPSLTTGALTQAETGTRYRVVVSVPGLTQASQEATVTVGADLVAPTLVAARRSFTNDTQLTVTFNELLDPTTAATAANYKINNGAIAVSSATLGSDNRSVVLTTAPIAAGTTATLTVSTVRDKAGNVIAAASTLPITFQRGILYVHSSAGPNPSDQLLRSRLESQGYYVEQVGATTSDATLAVGKNLVITSSTISSGEVTSKFKDSAVPTINWEQAVQDDFAMTTVGGSADRGSTGGQTSLEIVNASHPMAAGFPTGVVQVVTTASEFAWGQPNTNANLVARLVGTQNYGIYGYDKGARLTDGTPAAERRVQMFMTDNTPAVFNDAGWKLWDAAVNWAQGITVAVAPRLTAVRSGANVTITWSGNGVLQQTTSLTNSASWTDVTGNPAGTYTEPLNTAAQKFFRVRSQ